MTFPFTWRLYYDDHTTFDSNQGEPHESPPWGVIGVTQPTVGSLTARDIVGKNGDYLLYRTDLKVWHLVGASGLIDHLAHFGHLITCIRPTRWMPLDSEFAEVWEKMRREVDV
jgi:hypothetical protein